MHEKTIIIVNDKSEKPVEPTPSPFLSHPVEEQPLPPAPEAVSTVVSPEPAPAVETSEISPAEETIKPAKTPNPSRFDGKALPFFFLNIGCFLLGVLTIGIMLPWCLCWTARYEAAHTYVDGKPFIFDGRGSQLIGKWLLYILLFVLTCGLFGLWIPKKIENWKLSHVHLLD